MPEMASCIYCKAPSKGPFCCEGHRAAFASHVADLRLAQSAGRVKRIRSDHKGRSRPINAWLKSEPGIPTGLRLPSVYHRDVRR